jgi:hypothetical protein
VPIEFFRLFQHGVVSRMGLDHRLVIAVEGAIPGGLDPTLKSEENMIL